MTTNNPPDRPASRIYRRVFPGRPDQISEVRRFIRARLAGHQRTADVTLVATELTTNAWEHTHSHRGTFTVRAELRPDDTIHLEVEDNGGPPTFGEYKRNDEGGRGLSIVDALTSKWGVAGDSTGRTVWAEFR